MTAGATATLQTSSKVVERDSHIKVTSNFQNLVIVPGHAIYTGLSRENIGFKKYWVGDTEDLSRYYVEHVFYGIRFAALSKDFFLSFSGGRTFKNPLMISESEGYWNIAEQHRWNGDDFVKSNSTSEEFARDSLESLTFSFAKFFRFTGRKPSNIIVTGWDFEKERYLMHAEALGIKQMGVNFQYIAANNPVGTEANIESPLGKAMAKEEELKAEFRKAPFGSSTEIRGRRLQRDPYFRSDMAYDRYIIDTLFPMLRKL